jgi:DNA-binding MarR family transcriptional regulator
MNIEALILLEMLIPHFQEYLRDKSELPDQWMGEFGNWLLNAHQYSTESMKTEDDHIGILIGMQLISLSNRLRVLMNKFVSESPFSTFMDYQFLYVVSEHQEMTKSELISANSMEMSSGIEVINRLLRHQWISERTNPQDKRSKLVTATLAGRQLISQYSESAKSIYTSFADNLLSSDKNKFLSLLSSLTGLEHVD